MPRAPRFADPSYARDYVDQLYVLHAEREDRRSRLPAVQGPRPQPKTFHSPAYTPDIRSKRNTTKLLWKPEGPVLDLKPISRAEAVVMTRQMRTIMRNGPRTVNKARQLAKLASKIRRAIPGPLRAWDNIVDLLDLLEQMNPTVPKKAAQPRSWDMKGYTLDHQCNTSNPNEVANIGNSVRFTCLSGQAATFPYTTETDPAWPYISLRQASFSQTLQQHRAFTVANYSRPAGYEGALPVHIPFWPARPARGVQPMPNDHPNIRRHVPAAPQPRVAGVPWGMAGPTVYDAPDAFAFSFTSPGASSGGNLPPIKIGIATPQPRQPPGKGQKERKALTKSKRFAIGLFKILDKVSEGAEIVDAFYKALPPEIRKKSPCDRKNFGIDQAGQYGIDNADCKMKVLYQHWQKVDLDQAVRNVIKNEIEDKIHGAKHRALPKNWGAATKDADKEFGKFLNDVLDGLIG